MSDQSYRIPNELIERLRAEKDRYKSILGKEYGTTFWLLRDLLLIIDDEEDRES